MIRLAVDLGYDLVRRKCLRILLCVKAIVTHVLYLRDCLNISNKWLYILLVMRKSFPQDVLKLFSHLLMAFLFLFSCTFSKNTRSTEAPVNVVLPMFQKQLDVSSHCICFYLPEQLFSLPHTFSMKHCINGLIEYKHLDPATVLRNYMICLQQFSLIFFQSNDIFLLKILVTKAINSTFPWRCSWPFHIRKEGSSKAVPCWLFWLLYFLSIITQKLSFSSLSSLPPPSALQKGPLPCKV